MRFILTLFTAFAVLVTSPLFAQRPNNVAQVYTQLCSSCHGPELQGGSGGSLLLYPGNDEAEDRRLARIIRDGAEPDGMPAFGEALDDRQVRSLVIYIREMSTRAAEREAPRPRPRPAPDRQPVATQHHAYTLENYVEGLEIPWSLAFLPDNSLLIAERAGRLRLVSPEGTLNPAPVADTPAVFARSQGGLLAAVPHPDFTTNGWIYLAFSDPRGTSGEAMTAVVRGRIRDHRWTDEQEIYRAPTPLYRSSGVHYGTRIVFQDNYLFFAIGDRGAQNDAQDLAKPNGKIHRLHHDGRIPADNPFVRTPGALPSIWSYGHRNPQGLAFHPESRLLWSTEHGPRGGDELNLVRRGLNYGWPLVTHGMNYNGTPITAHTSLPGLESPVLHWTPSIAVCGINFYPADRFPAWKNHLFVTSLRQQELRRLALDSQNQVVEEEVILHGIGQIRDVITGPDGYLYVALQDPGRIVRLKPASP